MDALIPLQQTKFLDETKQTVNARDLHWFLEVRTEFRNWVKNRINDFSFKEWQDFITVGKNLPNGGKQIDYYLTLDMAKELSMVERNDKGKLARQYFIECEKQLKQVAPAFQIPQTLPEALRLAADLAEQVEAQRGQLAIAKPKVEALDRISTADGSLCITNAAKDLQIRPKDLFAWLKENKWIYRRLGTSHWIGYQERIQAGLLEHKVTTFSKSDGSETITEQVRITSKGITRIAQSMEKEAA